MMPVTVATAVVALLIPTVLKNLLTYIIAEDDQVCSVNGTCVSPNSRAVFN